MQRHVLIMTAMCVGALAAGTARAEAQAAATRSCESWLGASRTVNGAPVGPASCAVFTNTVTLDGRAYTRHDIGLSGSVDGIITKTGDYKEYLTNAPELVFGQTADTGRRYTAVARYEKEKGAAITLIFPADRSAWNGKAWVTVHGRGRSFKEGNLKAWDGNYDAARPVADLNKYDRLMLAKGFALIKTHRTSSEGLGEIQTTLDDGSTVDFVAFNDSHNYITDFARVALRAIETDLGRRPTRTYFYGHSAGARIGRGFNYTPGLNRDTDGTPFFDGILADDGAAGGWLPIVMKDGRDVTLMTEADKAAFVPQLDVSHQGYNNIWPGTIAPFMSNSYLQNKRANARTLKAKGLTPKHRAYEVRGISHSGGESLPPEKQNQNLDMSKLMDRFIDILDAWVDKGVAPPASRTDDPRERGQVAAAIGLPEVACPLGVFYPYPNSTAGATAFAPFSGQGIEPLDGNKVYVDMNRNGLWDEQETVEQAWKRLGLLGAAETLTTERYVACVEKTARALEADGFLSAARVAAYVEDAKKQSFGSR